MFAGGLRRKSDRGGPDAGSASITRSPALLQPGTGLAPSLPDRAAVAASYDHGHGRRPHGSPSRRTITSSRIPPTGAAIMVKIQGAVAIQLLLTMSKCRTSTR
jgi:hypothetical protein